MSSVTWNLEAQDGGARAGWLDTPHGRVRTPAFMPVGTRAAVKAVDSADLVGAGTEIVLANTYHLMLRPGSSLISELGGLHPFMGWDGPILTDSGGFQIFSLEPEIDDQGARFRSVYDGSMVHLTPEGSVKIQEELGPDIAMVLDVCVGLPASRLRVEEEMERTLRWAERCLLVHTRSDQALFGIVQGGVDPDLRAKSAAQTAALGFPGFGIGGLSVGESADERNLALEAGISELPADKPRYVMGLGDTEGLLDAIARGADMFDCVLPTRLARHGKVLTRFGDFNLRTAGFEADDRPIDDACPCHTCQHHSRAYLRHLVRMKELSAHRLLTIHNLRYTLDLVAAARAAVVAGALEAFIAGVGGNRSGGSP
ncbi:MAG TPA: tRNA guanosine(34) transglycosylase Tgt [Acidimicrobiia bacterium]|nr:tRNA guanosine(34) transglycosylase Tgt [Acidimicrobiia bacterium]